VLLQQGINGPSEKANVDVVVFGKAIDIVLDPDNKENVIQSPFSPVPEGVDSKTYKSSTYLQELSEGIGIGANNENRGRRREAKFIRQ